MNRRKPQGAPSSKDEVAGEMKKSFEEDDRSLQQLQDDLEQEEEKYQKWVERNKARQELLEEVIERLDNLSELAESIAEKQPNDKEKDWENAVGKTKMELKAEYEKAVPPMKHHDKINSLKYKIMGGRLANGEDIDEVF